MAHPLHGDAAVRLHHPRCAARAARSGGRRRLPARSAARPRARRRAARREGARPRRAACPCCSPSGCATRRSSTRSARWRPTSIVVAAYGRILPRDRSSICRRAAASTCTPRCCRGIAARRRSPTPSWRATPMTGVCIMAMSEEMDAGDVLLVRETPIRPDDTTGTLTARLADARGRGARRRDRRAARRHHPRDAAARGGVTFAPRIERSHARLAWARPAVELERLVRAMQPAPAALTTLDGKTLQGAPRGRRRDRRRGDRPARCCAPTPAASTWRPAHGVARALLEVQLEGKRRLDVAAFLAGQRVADREDPGGERAGCVARSAVLGATDARNSSMADYPRSTSPAASPPTNRTRSRSSSTPPRPRSASAARRCSRTARRSASRRCASGSRAGRAWQTEQRPHRQRLAADRRVPLPAR